MNDDLESQNDSLTSSAGGGQEEGTEEVFVAMSQLDHKNWKDLAGTKALSKVWKKHCHPILSASRHVLEKQAFELAGETSELIVDVGASPGRTRLHAPGVEKWYIMPNLQHGDSRRRAEVSKYPGLATYVCSHTLEECTCVFDVSSGRPEARRKSSFVFTHSAYYINPMFLWELCRDANVDNVYVVGHYFDEPYGGFLDECVWESEGTKVLMTVQGQTSEPYIHELLPWNSGWRGPEGETVSAETIRKIGFSYLWRVTATKGSPAAERLFEDVKVSEPFLGPVQFTVDQRTKIQSNSKIDEFVISYDNLYQCGPWLITPLTKSSMTIALPISLITAASTRIAARDRTPDSFKEVVTLLRRSAIGARVPASSLAMVITVCAALGFIKNIKRELELVNEMNVRAEPFYAPLSRVLNLAPTKMWSCCKILAYIILPVTFTYFLTASAVLVADPSDEVNIQLVAALIFMLSLLCTFCCYRLFVFAYAQYHQDKGDTWVGSYREGHTTYLPTGMPVPVSNRALPGTTVAAPPKPVSSSVTITMPPALPSKGELREIPRLHISGLAPDSTSVNVFEPSLDTELSMLTNRILIDVPIPSTKVIDSAKVCIHKIFFDLNLQLDFSDNAFYHWIDTQKKKFTKPVIDSWIDLRTQLLPNEPPPRNAARPFLKLEKSSKFMSLEGQDAGKPRGIAPPSDLHKVVLGPIITQIYKRAVAVYSPKVESRKKIVYGSGYTTDALGKAVDEFTEVFPNATGVWLDGSNYDTTLQLVQQFGYLIELERAGLSPEEIRTLLETECNGSTANGIAFKADTLLPMPRFSFMMDPLRRWGIPYSLVPNEKGELCLKFPRIQMWSGRMDTNLADTLILMSVVKSWLDHVGADDYLIFVNGDDNFMLLPELDQDTFDDLLSWYRDFGFIATGGFSKKRSEWEFCSKLFWFGESNGVTSTVLGPKVGRVLARFGYTLDLPKEVNIASSANGLRMDANHVPMVNVVAAHTQVLCRKQNIKFKGSHKDYELHASKMYEPSPLNFEIMEERYGVNREGIAHFEQVVTAVESLPSFYHWPQIDEMAKVDQ